MEEYFTKKRTFIYLGGNISPDDRTYLWREEFTEAFKDEQRVVIVDPCKNKFNQAVRNKADDNVDHLAFMKQAYGLSQNILKPKDFTMIKMCSLAVMNYEIRSTKKPMIGTIFETAWCESIFRIPIIGIMGTQENRDNNPYANHPWIASACSSIVLDVDQAIETVKTFFLEY